MTQKGVFCRREPRPGLSSPPHLYFLPRGQSLGGLHNSAVNPRRKDRDQFKISVCVCVYRRRWMII